MSESVVALDLGFSLAFRGATYRFAPIDNLEVVGNFEAYLEKEAWKALERAKAHLSPPMYAEQSEKALAAITSGVYHFQGSGWRASLASPHHQKHLLWLMLAYHHRDATVDLVDAIYKDKVARESVQRSLLVDYARAEGVDPNVLLRAAGLTTT